MPCYPLLGADRVDMHLPVGSRSYGLHAPGGRVGNRQTQRHGNVVAGGGVSATDNGEPLWAGQVDGLDRRIPADGIRYDSVVFESAGRAGRSIGADRSDGTGVSFGAARIAARPLLALRALRTGGTR